MLFAMAQPSYSHIHLTCRCSGQTMCESAVPARLVTRVRRALALCQLPNPWRIPTLISV